MNQFTPGPWKVIKPGHLHPTEYLCVQIGEDESYTTLEMLPNDARLVAAAPMLLEACQKLVEWSLMAKPGCMPPLEAIRLAEAAIALATGEGRP